LVSDEAESDAISAKTYGVRFHVSSSNLNSDGYDYVTESRAGTNSPYVKAHRWVDAFSEVEYAPSVNIKGPSGVPYQ